MTTSSLAKKGRLLDHRGREIILGKKLGEGGEGIVYQVRNRPTEAVKIFHRVERERVEKLRAMSALTTKRLENYTAWVTSLVYSDSGECIGYTQPFLAGYQPIHLLYNPKSRAKKFPEAGVRFLLHTAANIARAFAVIHELGQVVGDINHANLFVSRQGLVRLIDCDSFQIWDGKKVYPCGVGVPDFQPPEWQRDRGQIRTKHQDAFGLAILIFHLLYLGRHPFSGIGLLEERSIEKAIQELDFIYSQKRSAKWRKFPPGTIPFHTYTEEICSLFEKAFTTRRTMDRPTAKEWVAVLTHALETMKECDQQPKHLFDQKHRECPWCKVESRCGISFFSTTEMTSVSKQSQLTWNDIWKAIEDKDPPFPPLPSPKEMRLKPSPAIRHFYFKRRRWRNIRIGCAILLVALSIWWQSILFFGIPLAFLLILFQGKPRKKLKELHQIYLLAEQDWKEAKKEYLNDKQKVIYRRQMKRLRTLRDQFRQIERLQEEKLHAARRSQIRTKREEYLSQFSIRRAKLSCLTPSKLSLLEANGIYTARQIRPSVLDKLPSLGPAAREQLLLWRKQLIDQFSMPKDWRLSPDVLQRIEREISWKKESWQRKAILARDQYLRWATLLEKDCRNKMPKMEERARRLAQAETNYLFLLKRG